MKNLLKNDINQTFQKYIDKSKEKGMTDKEIKRAINEGIERLQVSIGVK